MSASAPLYDDVVSLPPGGEAFFVETRDGKRLRLAHWPGVRGTVLIFPGRGEFIEKYAPVIARVLKEGWGAVILDWRGQGLSEKLPGMKYGHVRRFDEYQHDVAALADYAKTLPQPVHAISHSMGGLIVSRALAEGALNGVVSRAVFTAPMFGLGLKGVQSMVGPYLTRVAAAIGFGRSASFGATDEASYEKIPFSQNHLTNNEENYRAWAEMLKTHPELRTGGASFAWAVAAFDEMAACLDAPVPQIPLLCILGTAENLISVPTLLGQLERMPNASLLRIAGAKHEPYFETPEIAEHALQKTLSFLADA